MKYFLLLCFVLLVGCSKPAIREATVYRSEIDFIDAASKEIVDRAMDVINTECVCIEIVEGITVFQTSECDRLAETVLVIETRMKYHTDFMRYLGGISDDRPSRLPPEVPQTNTLCGESKQ